MPTPLQPVSIESVYENKAGARIPLPKRMAVAPPDVVAALAGLEADLANAGGKLALSDLFRSYDMQLASYMDYKSGKKTAFSPPPGGSLHEGGRAIDLSLDDLNMPLKKFWPIAAKRGFTPIISTPDSGASESWHFELRGSHTLVYAYYKAGKAKNFDSPYKAMAASAIVSAGVKVDAFTNQLGAYIQSGLIRLGHDPKGLDGGIGPNTRKALTQAGIEDADLDQLVAAVDAKLQAKFPQEFFASKIFPGDEAFS